MQDFLTEPSIFLAPMEGITDAPMRAFLTQIGGYDYCVSEFVRVSQEPLPTRAFQKDIPELATGSRTTAQTPVIVQLLGGHPERLAQSALHAIEAGAHGIDLNFGCPAKTVNRHDGGATLLKYPDRLEAIVRAVRNAVPAHISVSAKLRLGWENIHEIHRTADAAAAGGASWITIHARTRMQAYQPPVFWEPIGEVQARLPIPVVANGDIWSIEDWKRCREITRCNHYMFGRSALGDPYIALKVRALLKDEPLSESWSRPEEPLHWHPILTQFATLCDPSGSHPTYPLRRMKQWIATAAHRSSPLAQAQWVTAFKRTQSLQEAQAVLQNSP